LDPPAIAHFLRLGYWLISKVRVSSLDRARDSIDLVAASVDASLGIVEPAIFGEDFVNRGALLVCQVRAATAERLGKRV
jgi:hypothetical protein